MKKGIFFIRKKTETLDSVVTKLRRRLITLVSKTGNLLGLIK